MKLMNRIFERKHYIIVREFKYKARGKQQQLDKLSLTSLTPSQIKKKISEYLNNKIIDMEVDISDATFGLQTEDSTKNVLFFRKEDSNLKKINRKITQSQLQELSMLSKDVFIEKSIKVFLKEDKPGDFQSLFMAVEQISKQYEPISISIGQSGFNPSPGNTFRHSNIHGAYVDSLQLSQ